MNSEAFQPPPGWGTLSNESGKTFDPVRKLPPQSMLQEADVIESLLCYLKDGRRSSDDRLANSIVVLHGVALRLRGGTT